MNSEYARASEDLEKDFCQYEDDRVVPVALSMIQWLRSILLGRGMTDDEILEAVNDWSDPAE